MGCWGHCVYHLSVHAYIHTCSAILRQACHWFLVVKISTYCFSALNKFLSWPCFCVLFTCICTVHAAVGNFWATCKMCQIFRETKENELQNVLRAKRNLESKLAKLGSSSLEDADNSSRPDVGAWHHLCSWHCNYRQYLVLSEGDFEVRPAEVTYCTDWGWYLAWRSWFLHAKHYLIGTGAPKWKILTNFYQSSKYKRVALAYLLHDFCGIFSICRDLRTGFWVKFW